MLRPLPRVHVTMLQDHLIKIPNGSKEKWQKNILIASSVQFEQNGLGHIYIYDTIICVTRRIIIRAYLNFNEHECLKDLVFNV